MKCSGLNFATGEPIEISFGDLITGVDSLLAPPAADQDFLSPGWIDLQVNGFAGVDYNSPDTPHDRIAGSIREMFRTGVTRFFPTVITGAPEAMRGALRNLAGARESIPEGPAMEAFHLEGPYISPDDGPRGAHPARWVRPPDLDE
ncbi:MAG: N-acetylglucosamine-6-phosphate deacetylase, partial [Bryobacteraceae bacterium]